MSAKERPLMRMKILLAPLGALLLAGCISFGEDPPERLLTLTPTASAPAGSGASGQIEAALAVTEPSTPLRLDVNRVPVMTSDTALAYLEEAYWVEKPARLFRRVLAETIRAKGNRMVVGGGELEYAATTQLGGELVAMDYDAVTSSVVVRYDAVLQMPSGQILTRRFESVVPGVLPEALAVGPAFNRAANEVADQVAEWVG